MCSADLPEALRSFDTHYRAKKFWPATNQIRRCAQVLDREDLKAKVADAEVKARVIDIENPKTPLWDKIEAIEALARDHPASGAKYEALVPKLKERALAADLAAEKARKKREGVRIGMTKQDVLDSAWGRPEHINRTITSSGVHEQWVYGGRNYLYFTDGVLDSIQN
jgi:hypothetical protein